jgi:hypothetical protein
MNQKVLIIAGMHRSGTSLVTQWLYRCGLPIGEKLFPADVGNVQGHFEDTDFLEMHRRFLVKRDCPDTGFTDHPFPKLTLREKAQVKDLIGVKTAENDAWGWKDPRTCLFLDTYDELLPSAFYLFIVRDFHSTVNSLLAREYKVHMKKFRTKRGLSRLKWILFKKKPIEKIYALQAEQFLRIWIHYYEQILNIARTLPEERYLFVNYASLAEDDKDVFNRISDEWSFPLYYIPFTDVYKKELLSEVKNIEEYIHDKTLIEKAKRIEKEFREYLKLSLV